MSADVGVSMLVLGGILALACLVVGLYHLGLTMSGRVQRMAAAGHAAMGLGMAAMLAPGVDPVPQAGWVAVFTAVLAAAAVVAVRARSPKGEPGHLAVGAAAMLFMLLAGHSHSHSAGSPHTGTVALAAGHSPGPGGPAALLLTAVAMGLAAWFLADIVRLVARRHSVLDGPAGSGRAVTVAHRQVALPRIVMSAAMSIMLLGAV